MAEVFKLANLLHPRPNLLSSNLQTKELADDVTLLGTVELPNVTKGATELTPFLFPAYRSVPAESRDQKGKMKKVSPSSKVGVGTSPR